MSTDQMMADWQDMMTVSLKKQDVMRAALSGVDKRARIQSIVDWLKSVREVAKLLADYKDSYVAREQLGDMLGFMTQLLMDYLRSVMEILSGSEYSPRTLEMIAGGAAMTEITNDDDWLRQIGVQP